MPRYQLHQLQRQYFQMHKLQIHHLQLYYYKIHCTHLPVRLGSIAYCRHVSTGIVELLVVKTTDAEDTARQQYVEYLQLYKRCLLENDIQKLEGLWTELDVKWMGIK